MLLPPVSIIRRTPVFAFYQIYRACGLVKQRCLDNRRINNWRNASVTDTSVHAATKSVACSHAIVLHLGLCTVSMYAIIQNRRE
jgi:hypothetical protein